jgi:hypothetical protein
MRHVLTFDETDTTFSDVFVDCVSDITLEVEAIKSKKMRNDIQSINEHLDRINRALLGIVDAKLALAERSTSTWN